MPSFFSFQQGDEESARYNPDASPLLGRFRAVPRLLPGDQHYYLHPSRPHQGRRPGDRQGGSLLSAANARNSVHVGYGALLAAQLDAEGGSDGDGDNDDDDDYYDDDYYAQGFLTRAVRRAWRTLDELWITPRPGPVRKVVDKWWSRWALLVVLPASLAVGWCALPFPQYPLPGLDDPRGPAAPGAGTPPPSRKRPGHGAARVQVNFWFFLFVFYGFYNLTALGWITKVFNLYSLNWWPKTLGFPITITLIGIVSIAAPIPIYLLPETRWITMHNTAWISWTFCLMAMPVAIAFIILTTNERHLGLRNSLSETQRIFTSSWWTSEADVLSSSPRRDQRRRPGLQRDSFDLDAAVLQVSSSSSSSPPSWDGRARRPGASSLPVRLRRRWLPASFVRFVWFCVALLIGLLAYVLGEAYAEIYLRTLPHNNLETIVYVYGWIITVYLLDGLTGWILGGNEGERVGSYPLSWVFKLYFMLTYQTYVRALYARLRSPSQFVLLQVISSTTLIVLTPLTLSATFHWVLTILGLNGQSYGAYQKLGVRNVFIRFVAENASMMAFLASVAILHFGPNRDVYPYFSFDDGDDDDVDGGGYNFALTLSASSVTWACELTASFVVAGLIRFIYGVSVVVEGKLDLAVWPELLPTSVAVVLHVLQNMFFSIIRLQFPGTGSIGATVASLVL
ncbi:hypothetical protein RB595_002709 [Gaeumannomyces hyphopodioides]